MCPCSHVSGEEPQPGLGLERASLRSWLLLVEHRARVRWRPPSMEGGFRHRLGETSLQPDEAQCPHICKLQGLCQQQLYLLASQPCICSSAHSSTHSYTHPILHSVTHLLIHSFTHPILHSLTYSFIHSLIHLHTHSMWGLRSWPVTEQAHPLSGQVHPEQQELIYVRPASQPLCLGMSVAGRFTSMGPARVRRNEPAPQASILNQ